MIIRKVIIIIIIYMFFLLVFNAFSQINTDTQNANQLKHKITILEELEPETTRNEDQITHLKVSLVKYENLFKVTFEN